MAIIEIDDRQVLAALRRLLAHTEHLSPALREIGEYLQESTKKRFETTTAPDGSRWLLNSVLSTLLYKEGDKPLTDGGYLGNTINYQLEGGDALLVGSNMVYAAMMQFGGTKAEFPQLWGDIPARPFLGLSNDDKTSVLAILARYLQS